MSPKRQFPKFYEKAIPVVLTLMGIAVLGILLFTLGLACGLLPSG